VLALTRQAVPAVRVRHTDGNLCARGGYVLAEADGVRALTLLATGSEVHLALQARERLQREGQPTAVASLPCFELFARQDIAYRRAILGTAPRVAVEAAVPFGWTRHVADEADVIGMTGFGASAPASDLFRHFGITSDAVVARARSLLGASQAA
jgi:transketolase